MKKMAITVVLLIVSFITFLTSAFGWLSIYHTVPANVGAGVYADYFDGGDGKSANTAYGLSEPIHVYNLAWLQYMGILNSTYTADGTKIQQPYFKVKKYIDMEGMIIPPIGTQENPFVGNFDGGGYCISNFQVANHVGSGAIEKRPLSVVDMGETASIVGFFGVIGDIDGSLADKIVNDKEKADNEKVNAVKNLYLNNFTVRTVTNESLIGLLAGYVNGEVNNVGIGQSTMQIGTGVKPLTATEAMSAKLGALAPNDLLSVFSLIGLYDAENVVWENAPNGSGLGGSDAGDDGAGFGGSIDMASLVRRLTYMLSENQIRKSDESNTLALYPVNFTGILTGTNQILNYTADIPATNTGNKVGYLGSGSIIPLNVNTTKMFEGADQTITANRTDYLTNSYYRTNSSELILNSNTGYIVGGGAAGSAWVRARIQGVKGTKGGIKESIKSGDDTVVYDATNKTHNLTFYTVKPDGTNSSITESVVDGKVVNSKNFVKYADVTHSLAQMLNGSTTMSGIRFYSTTQETTNCGIAIKSDGTVDEGRITTATSVKLNNQTKSNYEMLNGAINFNLSENGYITTVAGTYFDSSTNIDKHSLFSLYEVERNENNAITKVIKIENIYLQDADKKTVLYNQDSKPEGYTLAFDSTEMNKLETFNAAYYFEIPVKKGEYALGGAVGETDGAYLMYLDIGANGDLSTGTPEQGTKQTYGISGVNFVEQDIIDGKKTVAPIDGENYPVATYQIALNTANTNTTGLTISFTRNSAKQIVCEYMGTDFKITPFTDGSEMQITPNAVANTRTVYKKEENVE